MVAWGMWMAGRYSASWGLELQACLSESPAAGRTPDPSWVLTVWAMALPESVRQNLLAEFTKSLWHLAVVVTGLELVV
jgi:hypothetical protein